MRTAAQLKNGEVERTAGVNGAILHGTELSHDGFSYRVRHVEWVDAGERIILSDETTTRDNYHQAVAEFHRQHLAATDQDPVSH